MPAAALYRRTPDDPEYRLLNIAVLHIVDGKIAELTGFDATDKPWLACPRHCDHTRSSDSAELAPRPAEHQRDSANTTARCSSPRLVSGQDHAAGKRPRLHQVQVHPAVQRGEERCAAAQAPDG